MFEDLFLAFYLLITIIQRFFANAIAYSMVGVSPECKHRSLCPVFHRIRVLGDKYAVRNAFYFFKFKLQTLKRIKFVTDAYLHVVCCHLETKNVHCRSASARIKSSNIVIIRHKLSLSCSICDFIKHKGSF